jgi:hypothetical protein
MKTSNKIIWAKCPSVTRSHKYFYTAFVGLTRYWVTELNGQWLLSDFNRENLGVFPTAKKAMLAAECQ